MQDRAFKVGDEVQIIKHPNLSNKPLGYAGAVDGILDERKPIYRMSYGSSAWYATADELTLISTTSGPYMAQHNADGTLTLTPVQEAEAAEAEPEVKRVPSMGEIWRGGAFNHLHLLVHDYGCPDRDQRLRPVDIQGNDMCATDSLKGRDFAGGDFTFAYPSLAAAVTAGAIK